MKIFVRKKLPALIVLLTFKALASVAQPCTTPGQTPSTAFPVCGTTTFTQVTVPLCSTTSLYVPGCSGDGANYENKNPFFYKFTCYVGGTLGFIISPLSANEDYDWQLYDITGKSPDAIFTDRTIIVSGTGQAPMAQPALPLQGSILYNVHQCPVITCQLLHRCRC